MSNCYQKLSRKKVVDKEETSTELHRVLTTVDLTLLGIGSTLGVGIYVLAGEEAKKDAGPAVVISFLIAAAASVLAGLCYAEFGARVPKAGSAYVYSYVCVGELIAFIVGWNLIMEYVIGVASVAKGYSANVDKLFDNRMSDAFRTYCPIGYFTFLSDYFDWFAFAITIALTLILAFGVKESSLFNNVFTGLNLIVVVFVVIAGSLYANPQNWFLEKKEIIKNHPNISEEAIGEGGFAPFGFHGIMKASATCFYGYVGFDAIATTGEEAKNPQRAIPLAIIFSLLFIFLAYFGISTVITMMVPYFLQDSNAPLPHAFMSAGFPTGQWIVSIGALFGLSTSLLGAMFPMPRVIYAMASDGVLFKFLAKVHPRFQTPLIATLIAGTFGGFMAAIFNLDDLINMMSIGTLTAYTLVAVCVLCLRYRKDVDGADDLANLDIEKEYAMQAFWKRWLNLGNAPVPTEASSCYTDKAITLYCILCLVFCAVSIRFEDLIMAMNIPSIIAMIILGSALIFIMLSLSQQPISRVKLTFKVPLVPFLPGISILVNTYLILKLPFETWVRFFVWMALGFIIYGICFFSGTTDKAYQASVEKRQRKFSKVSANGFRSSVFQISEKNSEQSDPSMPMRALNGAHPNAANNKSNNAGSGTNRNKLTFSTFFRGSMNSINDQENHANSNFLNSNGSTVSGEDPDRHELSNQLTQSPSHHTSCSNKTNSPDKEFGEPTTTANSDPDQNIGNKNHHQQTEVGHVAQQLVDSVIAVAHTQLLNHNDS